MALACSAAWALVTVVLLSAVASVQSQWICSSLRSTVVDAMAAATPSQIIGQSDPNQYVTFKGGQAINTDLFVVNGTLIFDVNSEDPSSVLTVTGNIYLLNNAKFWILPGANVDFNQAYQSQFLVMTFDSSEIGWTTATFSTGQLPTLLMTTFHCGTSSTMINAMDFHVRNAGHLCPFLWDSATLAVAGSRGDLMEVTVNEMATFTATDNDPSLYFLTIVTITSLVLSPITMPVPGMMNATIKVTQESGSDVTIVLYNSAATWGVWLADGCDVEFVNSSLYLFPTFEEPTTESNPIANVRIGTFGVTTPHEIVPLSSTHTVRFTNTEVYVWNVYLGGSATQYVKDSQIGETNCQDSDTDCTYDHVFIDGSGGFITTSTTSTAMYLYCNISTAVYATGAGSITTFYRSKFLPNAAKTSLVLLVNDGASLVLVDTTVALAASPAWGYQFISSGSGIILRANFIAPADGAVINMTVVAPLELEVEFQIYPVGVKGGYIIQFEGPTAGHSYQFGDLTGQENPYTQTYSWIPLVSGNWSIKFDLWALGYEARAVSTHYIVVHLPDETSTGASSDSSTGDASTGEMTDDEMTEDDEATDDEATDDETTDDDEIDDADTAVLHSVSTAATSLAVLFAVFCLLA